MCREMRTCIAAIETVLGGSFLNKDVHLRVCKNHWRTLVFDISYERLCKGPIKEM